MTSEGAKSDPDEPLSSRRVIRQPLASPPFRLAPVRLVNDSGAVPYGTADPAANYWIRNEFPGRPGALPRRSDDNSSGSHFEDSTIVPRCQDPCPASFDEVERMASALTLPGLPLRANRASMTRAELRTRLGSGSSMDAFPAARITARVPRHRRFRPLASRRSSRQDRSTSDGVSGRSLLARCGIFF